MIVAGIRRRIADRLRHSPARLRSALRAAGLLLAVGALIEFLPIDLAVVAVLVLSMHASMAAGLIWHRVRRLVRR